VVGWLVLFIWAGWLAFYNRPRRGISSWMDEMKCRTVGCMCDFCLLVGCRSLESACTQ